MHAPHNRGGLLLRILLLCLASIALPAFALLDLVDVKSLEAAYNQMSALQQQCLCRLPQPVSLSASPLLQPSAQIANMVKSQQSTTMNAMLPIRPDDPSNYEDLVAICQALANSIPILVFAMVVMLMVWLNKSLLNESTVPFALIPEADIDCLVLCVPGSFPGRPLQCINSSLHAVNSSMATSLRAAAKPSSSQTANTKLKKPQCHQVKVPSMKPTPVGLPALPCYVTMADAASTHKIPTPPSTPPPSAPPTLQSASKPAHRRRSESHSRAAVSDGPKARDPDNCTNGGRSTLQRNQLRPQTAADVAPPRSRSRSFSNSRSISSTRSSVQNSGPTSNYEGSTTPPRRNRGSRRNGRAGKAPVSATIKLPSSCPQVSKLDLGGANMSGESPIRPIEHGGYDDSSDTAKTPTYARSTRSPRLLPPPGLQPFPVANPAFIARYDVNRDSSGKTMNIMNQGSEVTETPIRPLTDTNITRLPSLHSVDDEVVYGSMIARDRFGHSNGRNRQKIKGIHEKSPTSYYSALWSGLPIDLLGGETDSLDGVSSDTNLGASGNVEHTVIRNAPHSMENHTYGDAFACTDSLIQPHSKSLAGADPYDPIVSSNVCHPFFTRFILSVPSGGGVGSGSHSSEEGHDIHNRFPHNNHLTYSSFLDYGSL
ncbi:hypothetical protein SeMB42_g07195 [Synchytrium endobioticum]|uniref:Uncharacterized protein n=1 Tax=Synchytrium endobioticum TaxID=286115 RepID=A0A507C7A2_9FUNG|nr:hypothetical protein SeMB42_g07195 [Synchytrium endobioticum]TPX45023.1 hypothetical protein SeLEV6574_g04143 [Synchytrium endobioticum]